MSYSPLDKQVAGYHYTSMGIQPIEYITANKLGFMEGNIIKYVSRWKTKNGIEDLRKALHYTELLIHYAENEEPETPNTFPKNLNNYRNKTKPRKTKS